MIWNPHILDPEVQAFITEHLHSDITSLLLKGSPFPNVSAKELATQIEAKKRCEAKLPLWFQTAHIYYPNKLNIEQTSSEKTAQYKAELVSGNSLIDLTGGLGVDCCYFAKRIQHVTHFELNGDLQAIAKHNFKQLQAENIQSVHTDGISYLETNTPTVDWIYVDPSRRHDIKGKVFYLKDCLPNLPEHLELLWRSSHHIMVKASPMLDLSIGIQELAHTKAIHIVAVQNEVKELLYLLERDYEGPLTIVTANIKKDDTEQFSFTYGSDELAQYRLSEPQNYLYEPNAAIMKSGAFKSIAETFDLGKLHPNTHLYTSEVLVPNFPGRVFKITETLTYQKKALKKRLLKQQMNVSTRNFKERPEQIKQQFKIKDGGTIYSFFTTGPEGQKLVILTEKQH